VPGDILVLESGDHVAADARVLEAVELKTNEAILTGESAPVNKNKLSLPAEAAISERRTRCSLRLTLFMEGVELS